MLDRRDLWCCPSVISKTCLLRRHRTLVFVSVTYHGTFLRQLDFCKIIRLLRAILSFIHTCIMQRKKTNIKIILFNAVSILQKWFYHLIHYILHRCWTTKFLQKRRHPYVHELPLHSNPAARGRMGIKYPPFFCINH